MRPNVTRTILVRAFTQKKAAPYPYILIRRYNKSNTLHLRLIIKKNTKTAKIGKNKPILGAISKEISKQVLN